MWERKAPNKRNVPPPPMEPTRENRYVYGGGPGGAAGTGAGAGAGTGTGNVTGYAVRQNKHGVRKRMSTFNFIVGLFALGILVVLYINNTIAVDELTGQNNALRRKKQHQLDLNAGLQAEVNKKSSLERVGRIATEKLGMQYPREQPQVLEVPEDLKDRANDVRGEFPQ
jgi:cell division protein FtsL